MVLFVSVIFLDLCLWFKTLKYPHANDLPVSCFVCSVRCLSLEESDATGVSCNSDIWLNKTLYPDIFLSSFILSGWFQVPALAGGDHLDLPAV